LFHDPGGVAVSANLLPAPRDGSRELIEIELRGFEEGGEAEFSTVTLQEWTNFEDVK